MTIDRTKPAPGYAVNRWSKGWQANGDFAQMSDDDAPGDDPALDSAPEHWPDGVRFHATEADAIAASHRYREEFVRPDVVAFAERAYAWRSGAHARDEFFGSRSVAGLYASIDTLAEFVVWCDAQILAAARGERSLP